MARAFDDGSSQYLRSSGAPVTAAPFTFAFWLQYTDDAADVLVGIGDKDEASEHYTLYSNAGGPTDVITAWRTGSGSTDYANADATAKNTWTLAALSVTDTDDVTIYVNADGTAVSTDIAIGSWDNVTVAADPDSSPANYLTGYIADLAFWNAALTQSEINILVARFSPLFVKPENLAAYWPLIHDDNDRIGGYHFTAYNAPTWAAHPPIIYPAPAMFYPPAAAAAVTWAERGIGRGVLRGIGRGV